MEATLPCYMANLCLPFESTNACLSTYSLYNTVEGRGTRDTARCVARMRILSGNLPCGRLADQRSE